MESKKLLWACLVVAMATFANGKTALRRKPKIYNALITTDENLVQSRAYPVIQPTIHESGIAHYPVGPYSPYGYYNTHLVRFGQPLVPNLPPKEQVPFNLPQSHGPPDPQLYNSYPLAKGPTATPTHESSANTKTPPTAPALEESSPSTREPPTMLMSASAPELPKDPNHVDKMPSEQLPIALNQYGLPPSLMPLRHPPAPTAVPSGPPVFLPAYGFQPFSPIYNSPYPALRQPFLPHYGYLPNGLHFPLSNAIPTDRTYSAEPSSPPTAPSTPLISQTPQSPTPEPTSPPSATPGQPLEASAEPKLSFEDIKNGSKSADSSVPDVPPPPIPSGAKSQQS